MPHENRIDYEEKVRQLLAAVRQGDRQAFDALIEAVNHEVRKLSAYRLRVQPERNILQTTALVNEVVLKLLQIVDHRAATFPSSKEHFLALATRMMRFSLTDHARKRKLPTVALEEEFASAGDAAPTGDQVHLDSWSTGDLDTLIAVDEALRHIERSSGEFGPRRSAVLELFLFGGMNYREIAEELDITDDMARRDCQIGLARLRELLAEASAPDMTTAG